MEEAELLKERLLAITDKRKLQEEIAQRRLKIEEGKLKLHHLKKKSHAGKMAAGWIKYNEPRGTAGHAETKPRRPESDQRPGT